MLRILNKIRSLGTISDAPPSDSTIAAHSGALQHVVDNNFAHSLSIRHVDAGSCNGCELELHALSNAYYSIERYGIQFTASPRHADMMLVTGPVSRHMQAALSRCHEAIPAPKLVIACGDCAVNGGEFGVSYASCGALENVMAVDATISGCPPSPDQIIATLLAVMQTAGHHVARSDSPQNLEGNAHESVTHTTR